MTLHEPSLLYAYLALLTQSGLLQLLGCIGAHKLNEKLLNMYWLLLLFLLFGDAFIGVVWIFRFDKMYTDLKPILKQRLQMEYGVNEEFTNIWDNIQHDFRCCGVEGPQDFNDIDISGKISTKNNETKEIRKNTKYKEKSAENDRNRIIVDKTVNFNVRDYTKGYITSSTTMSDNDDYSKSGANDINKQLNSFLSTISTSSSEYPRDPNVKYVRNVPESCCRILTEDVPHELREEKTQEPQNKPTAIRQRLEKKKNRHQDTNKEKRSLTLKNTATTPINEIPWIQSKNCKPVSKRHAPESRMQFRNSHVRHESPYRNTHHYSTSTNPMVPNVTYERKTKEPKYSTGNFEIMDTCAHVNGHAIGTVYGMSETLHFSVGCEVKLKKWLRDSAHILGVLGYCVIAFLKLCFLGILKYEIREMIQKIKMLQGELQPPVLLLSTDSPNDNTEMNSPTSPLTLCNHNDNSILMTNLGKNQNTVSNECTKDSPNRIRANSLGNAFLLLQSHKSGQTTPVHQMKLSQNQQNHRLFNSILGGDPGNDSDTNSHCALLIDGDDPSPKKKHTRVSSNGNNNYESHELQDLFVRHSAQI